MELPGSATMPTADGIQTGSQVLVRWTDGSRYPGHVVQTSEAQHLVEFSDGARYWIHASYVSPA